MSNTHETPNVPELPVSHDLRADPVLEARVDQLFAVSDAAALEIGNRYYFDPLKEAAKVSPSSQSEVVASQPRAAVATAPVIGNLAVGHGFRLTA